MLSSRAFNTTYLQPDFNLLNKEGEIALPGAQTFCKQFPPSHSSVIQEVGLNFILLIPFPVNLNNYLQQYDRSKFLLIIHLQKNQVHMFLRPAHLKIIYQQPSRMSW